jgi:hypothetical protein
LWFRFVPVFPAAPLKTCFLFLVFQLPLLTSMARVDFKGYRFFASFHSQ